MGDSRPESQSGSRQMRPKSSLSTAGREADVVKRSLSGVISACVFVHRAR